MIKTHEKWQHRVDGYVVVVTSVINGYVHFRRIDDSSSEIVMDKASFEASFVPKGIVSTDNLDSNDSNDDDEYTFGEFE